MATETAAGHGAEAIGNAAAEAAGVCVNAHGGAVGLPQLCGEWMPNQIFWLVVTLVILFLILSRVALPRIATVLAARKGAITSDLAAAEDLKARAVAAEEAYNKALADARTEAQAIIAQNKAEMQAELDAALKEADAGIAAKTAESEKAIADIRAGALESIKAVATDTAAALVGALGGSADAATVADAVGSRLKG